MATRLDHLARPSREFPRRSVPNSLDLDNWSALEQLFSALAARSLDSVADIEALLLDWGELQSVLSEESARRYISMTCATDDPELERSYLHFVEQIEPRIKPWSDKLARKVVDAPACQGMPRPRYEILLRSFRNSIELFREQNIPLETELEKLSQQYQKLNGAMSVLWDGQECTLQRLALQLEEADRALRQRAWEAIWARRLQDKDAIEDVFDQMVELRGQVANNAGFDNFRDYIFRRNERFDYTPADCERFHRAVETQVVPMQREIMARRKAELHLDRLCPWDTECDTTGQPPLRPYEQSDRLIAGCREMFGRVDEELGAYFTRMAELDLLDLNSRKGKAPGGYQHDLSELRLPFIFMNAVGSNDDLYTLLHEGGHAFHAFAARGEPLAFYRGAPIEFCEVASMGMEQLASEHLQVFYSPANAARARLDNLTRILLFLPWCASIDAFQHWIYTHPGHTREQRRAAWLDLRRRFYGDVDYSGYEIYNEYRWQEKLHIFQYPFYYIEYGIAQLGALQLWLNSRRDTRGTVAAYKRALALGGSRPLPQLFEAAGIRFDFTEQTVAPVMRAVKQEFDRLSELEKAGA
ncbi:M3 family oligoendopeptidase [candidate division KSB1 bacterium]|nr:M3 family oligoendopeptidase [candidate division KSB1 bacterium]